MRTLALPDAVQQWSWTTPREKPVKIRAKILRRIDRLKPSLLAT